MVKVGLQNRVHVRVYRFIATCVCIALLFAPRPRWFAGMFLPENLYVTLQRDIR